MQDFYIWIYIAVYRSFFPGIYMLQINLTFFNINKNIPITIIAGNFRHNYTASILLRANADGTAALPLLPSLSHSPNI